MGVSAKVGDGHDDQVDPTVSEYYIPERIVGSRGDYYHQSGKRLAEYKARLTEATERSDDDAQLKKGRRDPVP